MLLLGLTGAAQAQIDSTKRELIQLGYNQPIEGHGPLSAYGFYYLNLPDFLRSNLTLRVAFAGVYVDSELGISHALGPHTDLGLGLSGGAFGDNYYEVRGGKYFPEESFAGHGGGPNVSVYHLFNPGAQIPLYGLVRNELRYTAYFRDSRTSHSFELPEDRLNYNFRTGLRWGGKPPVLRPGIAMELSGWYEALVRSETEPYGFNGDRTVEQVSHLIWGRGLLAYTLPKLDHNFNVSVTLGTSADPDRFSAYRLGGVLPLAAEFPLSLPGYYFQEISAQSFVVAGGYYSVPLNPKKTWSVYGLAATAVVDYLDGLQQPGNWLSGVGGGVGYRSPSGAWQVQLGYGYGIDAIRSHGRGANNIGILVQFDLERANRPLFESGEYPFRSRGVPQLFRWF